MNECPYKIQTCRCIDCASNAAYVECDHGYCICCFECLDKGVAVHNVWACSGYEKKKDQIDRDGGDE